MEFIRWHELTGKVLVEKQMPGQVLISDELSFDERRFTGLDIASGLPAKGNPRSGFARQL